MGLITRKNLLAVVPALGAVFLFVFIIFYYILPGYHKSLLDGKRATVTEVTKAVWSILNEYDKEVKAGTISLKDAQESAKKQISNMRYGPEMKDYVWINDMHPYMIMHPYRTDLNGSDLSNFEDPSGTRLFVEAVKQVRENGGGFIEYEWQWQDNPDRMVPKLSYVKGFEPWGWVIGSGLYINDVNDDIERITSDARRASFLIFLIIFLVMLFIVTSNIRITKRTIIAESSRRQSEKRFQTVINSTKDGMVAIDRSGIITMFNPAAEEMFGYTQKETIGKDIDILIPEQYKDKHKEYVLSYFSTGAPSGAIGKTIELPATKKNGDEFKIELSLSEGSFEEEPFVLAVIRDITRRKELENQLQQSQKMESIGRLAGGIAHDFNNLLTAILGNAELALMTLEPGDEFYEDLEEIVQNSKRAANLTGQLLAFSRKQVVTPKKIDCNTLLINMDRLLRRLITENIELVTLTADSLWLVNIDSGQMEQVLTNLVLNASDAMPDGGTLTIKTTNMVVEPEDADTYPDIQPGEYMMLTVRDTGNGIGENILPHIFEPFFTTKMLGKGSGLGLATCYGIIKQNDGNIYVESTLGEGTMFTVMLPRAGQDEGNFDATDESTEINGGSETLLIAEDEESVRKMIHRVLGQYGYTVVESSHGEEGLRVAETMEKRPDLLITDLIMPQMGGKELSEKLRAKYPDLPVIFMSGYTDDNIIKKNVKEHLFDFIHKPFTPNEIARKVREVLDRQENV